METKALEFRKELEEFLGIPVWFYLSPGQANYGFILKDDKFFAGGIGVHDLDNSDRKHRLAGALLERIKDGNNI